MIRKLLANLIVKKSPKIITHVIQDSSEIETIKLLQAKSIIHLNETLKSSNIQDYEFKVFSQWGDDGIIQYLIATINLPYKTFIEFGVQDYSESNTRFLLMNNNWRGLIMDGSSKNIEFIKRASYYWK